MIRSRWFKTLSGAVLIFALTGCGGGGPIGASGTIGGGNGGSGDTGAVATSITLEWDAPTARADGSALTVAHYQVYYGTSPGSYTTSVDVGNATTCTIDNLDAGTTYFFAVTAYDSDGNESEPSAEISKAI